MPKLNFFTPLLEKEKISPLRSKGFIVLVVFIIAVGAYLAVQGQVFILQKNIAEKEQQLDRLKTTELNEIMELKRKIIQQNSYLKMVQNLEREFTKADFVNLALIEKILDTVPQNLFFQDLTLDKLDWRLLGYADSRQTIAEFQYALKKSGFVDTVEISNINNKPIEKQGNFYAFSMEGTFNQEVVGHEN